MTLKNIKQILCNIILKKPNQLKGWGGKPWVLKIRIAGLP
jgi:hypothetical protein